MKLILVSRVSVCLESECPQDVDIYVETEKVLTSQKMLIMLLAKCLAFVKSILYFVKV